MSSRVSDIFGHPASIRRYAPSDAWVLPKERVGIEFEYENVHVHNIPPNAYGEFYDAVEDGSLRERGYEFRFREPFFGEDISSALDVMGDLARAYKFSTGPRTSVHVHLDCRDLSTQELHKLAIFYTATERALFNFAGAKRADSNFCVPWYRSNVYFRFIANLKDKGADHKVVKENFSRLSRYSALNLAALSKHGSIEFRQMEGTADMARVKAWVNIIMCLKKAAREYPWKEYDILLHLSQVGANAFVQEIYGARLEGHYTPQEIWSGVIEAQNLLTSGAPASFASPFALAAKPGKLLNSYLERARTHKPVLIAPNNNDKED